MAKVKYDGIIFDSEEEVEFYCWLIEAQEVGIVKKFIYHDQSYELTPKVRYNDKHLFRKHEYTPDFVVWFNKSYKIPMKPEFMMSILATVIDIKGKWNLHGGDKNFSINQKLMWDKHDMYVHKVIPEELFLKTWCPERARLTKVKKEVRKKYQQCGTIKDFIEAQGVQGVICDL